MYYHEGNQRLRNPKAYKKDINHFNKMGTLGKLGTVGLGAAAIGGLGYGAYKLSNNNKDTQKP